ncbi:unnamed protein product [Musa acuminata subsp. malaccensis]|uniref:(wild Malaysian banana) hypothetical protein n=1 Tax=Musa acuminata subsp. malaccensis TaxID=214687 RepID=A0A804IUN0_MUSAM|nr:unnamed protein product [Musa acuminata subsp. malaccensis]
MMYHLSWCIHMLGGDTSKNNTATTKVCIKSILFVPAKMIRCLGPRHQRMFFFG